ncbi:helix-turn-helix transcriptional regulator [Nonomuraea sp. NPDC050643]|uniref:helix-turn-helix domain-containing protein n=1 Tax=Nonomuraea sp. NPDC050643 TaxID=3155660 RepID=UPI0033C93522
MKQKVNDDTVLVLGGDERTREAIAEIITFENEFSTTVHALRQAAPRSTVIIVGVGALAYESADPVRGTPPNALSRREREVLSLVAEALSNAQVASRMGITEGTVKRHLRNIFTKLGAVSRMDAVIKGGAVVNRSSPPRGHGRLR